MTCGDCRHFEPGKPLGTCSKPDTPLSGFRVHAEAEHPCHERKPETKRK